MPDQVSQRTIELAGFERWYIAAAGPMTDPGLAGSNSPKAWTSWDAVYAMPRTEYVYVMTPSWKSMIVASTILPRRLTPNRLRRSRSSGERRSKSQSLKRLQIMRG